MNIMLAPGLVEKMISHAKSALPAEACGLLVGHGSNAMRLIRAQNVLASEVAYEIDPALLASTFRSIRDSGESLVAIFHSHPKGPAEPSSTDLERAYYPEVVHIIVSLADADRPQVRGFRIIDGQSYEIELHAFG